MTSKRIGPALASAERDPFLPRPLVVLGEALCPVSDMIARRMEDVPPQVHPCLDFAGFASRHLRMIEDDVARLVEAINHELGVATVADTADSAVWRATSRLEVHIEGLLDRFDDVRRVKPENGDARAHSLLCGVYRDLLEQVQTWLNEIVVSLDDPVLALRRRGLPTQGRVDLTIALTLEPPWQVESLARWAEERATELASSARSCIDGPEHEVTGQDVAGRDDWLSLALVAFGLGWLLGGDGDE